MILMIPLIVLYNILIMYSSLKNSMYALNIPLDESINVGNIVPNNGIIIKYDNKYNTW